jgi:hypothetical protein
MGRSRGGLTTKIHALVDANGLPIRLKITEGQAHDGRSADDMLATVHAGCVLLIVRALARAHRWRRMLEDGKYATLGEISKAEKVNASYLSRVIRLSLLAPDVIEAILDGRLREGVQLGDLLEPLPMGWEEQRGRLLRPTTVLARKCHKAV